MKGRGTIPAIMHATALELRNDMSDRMYRQ